MNTFIIETPTLRQVARAAGVSVASASYALRRHPTVSAETWRRVEEAAARLGYRANPQLSAFMQARRTGRSMRTDVTVALVHGDPRPPAKNETGFFPLCLRGFRALAAERGYGVDALRWDAAADPKALRLTRVLDQRGVRGLLLVPSDKTRRWTLPLDWTRFFGVALDHSPTGVPVHRVTDHHAADMMTALERVKAAGWRRPGLVLDAANNERTLELRLGAFLARTSHDFPEAPPPLVIADKAKEPKVRAWLRRHRPDVVLSPDRDLAAVAEGRGERAFISLANYTQPAMRAGILIDCEAIGRTAAFLLFSLLENPATAGALRQQSILIEGTWRDG